MENTSVNPPPPDARPLTKPGKLICTRLMQTRLAPNALGPSVFARSLARFRGRLKMFWRALVARLHRPAKSLVVMETAALGERRLISVVQFENQRFLIGCSPSQVTLLARLPDAGAGEASTEKQPQAGTPAEEGFQ